MNRSKLWVIRNTILVVAVFVAAGILLPPLVFAGMEPVCQTVPTVESRIENAQLVVLARAEQATMEIKGSDELQTWFVVEKVLKGSIGKEKILVTDCSQWKCEGRTMRQGEKYILLLTPDMYKKDVFALHPLGCRVKSMEQGSILFTKSAIPWDEKDRMVSQILWLTSPATLKLSYADGSGNQYRLYQNSIEYIPVEPAMSSTGYYSGGQFARKSITADQFQIAAKLFERALSDEKAKIKNRIKGSVFLQMEKDQKKTSAILKVGEALLELENYLKSLMADK